jgi:hypothetical protein
LAVASYARAGLFISYRPAKSAFGTPNVKGGGHGNAVGLRLYF